MVRSGRCRESISSQATFSYVWDSLLEFDKATKNYKGMNYYEVDHWMVSYWGQEGQQ